MVQFREALELPDLRRPAYGSNLSRFAEFALERNIRSSAEILVNLLETCGRDLAAWERDVRTKNQHIAAVRSLLGWPRVRNPMPSGELLNRVLPFPKASNPMISVPPPPAQREMLHPVETTRNRLNLEMFFSAA